jgi:hypothetical protein
MGIYVILSSEVTSSALTTQLVKTPEVKMGFNHEKR